MWLIILLTKTFPQQKNTVDTLLWIKKIVITNYDDNVYDDNADDDDNDYNNDDGEHNYNNADDIIPPNCAGMLLMLMLLVTCFVNRKKNMEKYQRF